MENISEKIYIHKKDALRNAVLQYADPVHSFVFGCGS